MSLFTALWHVVRKDVQPPRAFAILKSSLFDDDHRLISLFLLLSLYFSPPPPLSPQQGRSCGCPR